jgi:hypothetical protein
MKTFISPSIDEKIKVCADTKQSQTWDAGGSYAGRAEWDSRGFVRLNAVNAQGYTLGGERLKVAKTGRISFWKA